MITGTRGQHINPMSDEAGVLPTKNSPLAGSWESGKPISEEVGKRAHHASSTLKAPEGGVSDWLVDERMIGLSGLLPQDPIGDVSLPVEGCPSMGEERDVTEGVMV